MPSTMSLRGYVFNDAGAAQEGVEVKVFKKNTTATALVTATSDTAGLWTAAWSTSGDTDATQVDVQGTSGTSVFRWKYDDRVALNRAFIEDLHIIPERDFAFKFTGAPTQNRTITFSDNAGTVALLGAAQTFSAAQTFTNTVTVGVDDDGKDVKFFGESAGAYMEWDESEDQLRIMGASADATTSTGKLLLATSLTNINANDVIGKIDFQAPHETGTDAVAIAASIQAVAQGTFSASVNATDLIFSTGHSEAATEKFRITSQGELGIGGATYGSSGDVLTSGGAGAAPTWETPTTGDITGVTAGVGLSGGGASGSVTLTLDLSELSTVTPADGDFFATLDSDGANEQKTTTTALATLFAGTNLTASSSVINVDDAFLKNNASDTTTGTVTMAHLIIGNAGNIGSASDGDAIAISSAGVVTFSQAVDIQGGYANGGGAPYDGVVDAGGGGNWTTLQAGDDALGHTYSMLVKAGTYSSQSLIVTTDNVHIVVEPGTDIGGTVTLSGANIKLSLGPNCDLDGLVVSGNDCVVDGGGWSTIVDGTTANHGIEITGSRVTVQNIATKTTAGDSTSFDAVSISGSGGGFILRSVRIVDSDRRAIDYSVTDGLIEGCLISGADAQGIIAHDSTASSSCRIIGNRITATGSQAILLQGAGDNSVIVGNEIQAVTGVPVEIGGDAENCVVVGNRLDGSITDSSGTSTVASNDLATY